MNAIFSQDRIYGSRRTGEITAARCLSIGICDLIYRDRSTGKRTILGCFTELHAVSFPAIHPALGVYADLTNGRNTVKIRVQIVDADEVREPIFKTVADVQFLDPRMIAELDFMVGGLVFAEPGEYRVQVFGDDQFIVERRIVVNKLELKQ